MTEAHHYDDYLETRITDLESRLEVATRLLNFTPDQLELLIDPAKLAYLEWNVSSTYTLQLMCETYREGKMEVRELKRQLAEAQACSVCDGPVGPTSPLALSGCCPDCGSSILKKQLR